MNTIELVLVTRSVKELIDEYEDEYDLEPTDLRL